MFVLVMFAVQITLCLLASEQFGAFSSGVFAKGRYDFPKHTHVHLFFLICTLHWLDLTSNVLKPLKSINETCTFLVVLQDNPNPQATVILAQDLHEKVGLARVSTAKRGFACHGGNEKTLEGLWIFVDSLFPIRQAALWLFTYKNIRSYQYVPDPPEIN